MTIRVETVAKYSRQNTGRHFLDSGDHYGRIYDAPVMSERVMWNKWGELAISVTHMLAEFAEVHPIHKQFYQWDKRQAENLPWFEGADRFMRERGYECAARDNTYNAQTDLDQNFVWEIWVPEHESTHDWFYADDAIVALYLHTGCDVRGGYSSPLFVQFTGEGVIPFSFSAHLYSSDLPEDEADRIGYGYSDYPIGELEKLGYQFTGEFEGDRAEWKHTDTGKIISVYAEFDCY